MGASAEFDGMQQRRLRKQLAEPGAHELLAAYADASRAVQRSILKLLVEINEAKAEGRRGTVSPLNSPPGP